MNPTLRTPHAKMEIAVLLGLTGRHPPEPLWSLLPALRPAATTMLGNATPPIDRKSGSPASRTASPFTAPTKLRLDPDRIAARAAAHVAVHRLRRCPRSLDAGRFDLGAAHQDHQNRPPDKGCQRWSIGVYNPDLDPDGRDAEKIVDYIAKGPT